jgi:peptidyl-tRNA hydrolase, PTH1 family
LAADTDAATWLVVGLGNPGAEYADHRHNVGFMVLDLLASRWGVAQSAFRAKFGSALAQADVQLGRGASRTSRRVHLQKPLEFMNVSGGPLQRAMAYFRVEMKNVLVIHDEIDLPFLRLRVKVGGGHGGHNGLRSISQAIGPDYLRLRVGVGRPGQSGAQPGEKTVVTGHVLGAFNRAEQKELPDYLGLAADAVEAILEHGATHAMNKYNKDLREPSGKE